MKHYFRYADNNEGDKVGFGILTKALLNASSSIYLKSVCVKPAKKVKERKQTIREKFLSHTIAGQSYKASELSRICQRLGLWEQYYLYCVWDGEFKKVEKRYVRV